MVKITDRPDMTSAVYRGRKAPNQTKSTIKTLVPNYYLLARKILLTCLCAGRQFCKHPCSKLTFRLILNVIFKCLYYKYADDIFV